MKNGNKNNLIIGLSLGSIILGGLFGYFLPEAANSISFFGHFYLSLLIYISIPLLILITINGVGDMGDYKKSNRSMLKIFGYILSTSSIAALLGLVISFLFNPTNMSIASQTAINKLSEYPTETFVGLKKFTTGQIFNINPFMSGLSSPEGSALILSLLTLAIIFGSMLYRLGAKEKIVTEFFKGMTVALKHLVSLLIFIAPVGLFFLSAELFAKNSNQAYYLFDELLYLSLSLIISLTVFLFVILPLILRFIGHRSPVSFFTNLLPALSTAFATGSQTAALPMVYENLSEESDIDNRAVSMTLPIGSMFSANGTAIYLVIATLFIARLTGQILGPLEYLLIFVGSVLLSFLGRFIPTASLAIVALFFTILGFGPLAFAGIGILIAGDWLFNRLAQVVNVFSDAVGAAVIGESFDFKTARVARSFKAERTVKPRLKKPAKSDKDKRTRRDDKKPARPSSKDKPAERKKRVKAEPKTRTKKETASTSAGVTGRPTKPDKAETVTKSTPKVKEPKVTTAKLRDSKQKEVKPKEAKAKDIKVKDIEFKMPPVPHHFLEEHNSFKKEKDKAEQIKSDSAKPESVKSEKSKKPAEPKVDTTPIESSKDDSTSASVVSIKLEQEMFQREREKVSAQLKAMREAIEDIEIAEDSPKEDKIKIEDVDLTNTTDSSPTIDFYSDPITPDEPVKQNNSVTPDEPVVPIEPVETDDSIKPIETSELLEPIDPAVFGESTPTEKPLEVIDPFESDEHASTENIVESIALDPEPKIDNIANDTDKSTDTDAPAPEEPVVEKVSFEKVSFGRSSRKRTAVKSKPKDQIADTESDANSTKLAESPTDDNDEPTKSEKEAPPEKEISFGRGRRKK